MGKGPGKRKGGFDIDLLRDPAGLKARTDDLLVEHGIAYRAEGGLRLHAKFMDAWKEAAGREGSLHVALGPTIEGWSGREVPEEMLAPMCATVDFLTDGTPMEEDMRRDWMT